MENKDVIAVNSVGDTENQCVAGGGHQRSSYRLIPKLLLQLHALTDNPMNITVTGNITVSATLEAQLPSS